MIVLFSRATHDLDQKVEESVEGFIVEESSRNTDDQAPSAKYKRWQGIYQGSTSIDIAIYPLKVVRNNSVYSDPQST
ncbi:MAG TPA: hypothetical protein VGL56_01090 [Fimbriimonadaceae bacterium]